jgi:ABC-type antimicrobial peptide transport system permease subunit
VQAKGTSLEVIGVAANTTALGEDAPADPALYVPISQAYAPRTAIVVRVDSDPAAELSAFRRALHVAAPDTAVFDVRTVADSAGLRVTPVRVAAIVLGVLGLLGFGIAMLGVYGTMAYAVSQRIREFGVHKALGATPSQIRAMVRRQGLWLLLRGVVPGLVVAFIAAGFLRHLLYGIQPHDPITFLVVPLLLLSAGLAASYLPARRAARVDANVMLRDL